MLTALGGQVVISAILPIRVDLGRPIEGDRLGRTQPNDNQKKEDDVV